VPWMHTRAATCACPMQCFLQQLVLLPRGMLAELTETLAPAIMPSTQSLSLLLTHTLLSATLPHSPPSPPTPHPPPQTPTRSPLWRRVPLTATHWQCYWARAPTTPTASTLLHPSSGWTRRVLHVCLCVALGGGACVCVSDMRVASFEVWAATTPTASTWLPPALDGSGEACV
jgi:hypothetical protein